MRHTISTITKISDMRRGAKNPFYGRKHTDEWKAAQSARTRAFNANRQYQPSPQSLVVPTDAAVIGYLAGMIDADGSIRFSGGRPFVAVYNTNRALISWIMDTLKSGGVSKGNMGREQVLAWRISGARDVYALVQTIRPFLIVKVADADAAIEHLESRPWGKTLR